MIKRLIVAILFLPVFTWLITLSNPVPFYFLMLIGVSLAVFELGGLITNKGIRYSYPIVLIGVLLICLKLTFPQVVAPLIPGSTSNVLWSIIIFTMLLLSFQEITFSKNPNHFVNISANLYAVLLIGGIGSYVALLRQLPNGSWWLLLLFGFNWFYDSAALFAGKYFGKHKLAPAISPAKTIEGLIGGLVMNVIVAVIIFYTLLPQAMSFSLIGFVGLGILIGLTSQAGDLVESLIKRWSGKKDSSTIIPGHGGILDKIDNLIFSAPCLYAVAQLMVVWRS